MQICWIFYVLQNKFHNNFMLMIVVFVSNKRFQMIFWTSHPDNLPFLDNITILSLIIHMCFAFLLVRYCQQTSYGCDFMFSVFVLFVQTWTTQQPRNKSITPTKKQNHLINNINVMINKHTQSKDITRMTKMIVWCWLNGISLQKKLLQTEI